MKGTIVNAGAIIAGGLLGIYAGKMLGRYQEEVSKALKLVVVIIGIQMALKGENMLITFGSLVIGIIIGELLNLVERINSAGLWLANIVNKLGSNVGASQFQEGFVTTSMIYCVGAMAILGAIQDGLTGNADILYLKSALDGISAIMFAATWGLGVVFSALSVFIYQGSITLLAQQVSGIFTPHIINEVTAVGGVAIMALGLKMLNILDVKIANWLPAIFVAMLISSIF